MVKNHSQHTINGVPVTRTRIFSSGGFWRWKIVDAHGTEFVDGGNYLRREAAETGLAAALGHPPAQ